MRFILPPILGALGLLLALRPAAQSQQDELRQAARLDAEHRCEEADRIYQQALAKGPPSAPLLNNLGNHYLICGQERMAQSCFERLLHINPEHTNANLQLARMAVERKDGAQALQYLSRVRESSPVIRLLRAEASHYAGRSSEALEVLTALEQDSNTDLRVLFAVGITCARIGLYDRAEAAFQRVLAARPDDFDVLYNLGRAAARAQHYSRAQQVLEVAVRVRPSDMDALLELGLVYAALEDYSRSVYVLAQARQRAPQRPDILIALARAAEDAGYYGDSLQAYDEYLNLRPEEATVRRDRARVRGLTGTRLEEGLRDLTAYVQSHPRDPIGFYYQAQLTWKAKPEAALDQLSTALRLDPRFAAAHYARGWLLKRIGRTRDALADFQAAAQLQPKTARILDQLALAHLSLDEPAGAEKVLRLALEIAPRDPEVLMHMGQALIALDREDEAQRYLSEFRKYRGGQARDPRREAGMIELATLSPAERTQREIHRLREDTRSHPSDPELALHLAGLLLADGQTQEAVAVYQELLSRNASGSIWQQAGATLAAAGQYALARTFLERAVDAGLSNARLDLAIATFFAEGPEPALKAIDEVPNPEREGDYWLMKARLLEAAGQISEAEEAIQEGLSRSSSRADVAQQAAALLLGHKRDAEALQLVSRVAAANPDLPDLLLTQAILLGLTDRSRDAERALKQLEARWPEWDRAYLAHGLLLERMGQAANARQKLRTALALGSTDPILHCALGRLDPQRGPEPECECADGLRALVLHACR